ncbi:bifunctional 6-phosphofructo-2-kinase/fructose-2,6-bisphosphate 2-phosphatase [Hyaloscypha variabilis]
MYRDQDSKVPRVRPPADTLNIPGMTRSKVSPDGKITHTGAKLVVIMVGLPARGQSRVTDKIRRYLSWQQHHAKTFRMNNGRSIASGADTTEKAEFFDPRTKNERASFIRENLALSTLDDLLEYLLFQGGSVGILDALNLTLERRKALCIHVKEREPKLGVVFIESVCEDGQLLEANIASELRGPDYEGNDPASSLADFEKRLRAYESVYVPLGYYEEENNMQYIKVIDIGRKTIHHRLQGFLTGAIASYLSTFNTSPRQIWITRHGQSYDNILSKIGGDSNLTEEGVHYASALYKFINRKRAEWDKNQQLCHYNALEAAQGSRPGDKTPPNPDTFGDDESKNFCVWTSMLKRSIYTAKEFEEDDDYDVMAWEMLNQLNTGDLEGLTFEEIEVRFPEEHAKQRADKLHYIYPGVGGEGYLQVISRLREFIREMERIKDHILVIGHSSICRVLMAYLLDLTRDDIADLDMPLGMLYSVETKDDGVELHAYRYKEDASDFMEVPGHLSSQRL